MSLRNYYISGNKAGRVVYIHNIFMPFTHKKAEAGLYTLYEMNDYIKFLQEQYPEYKWTGGYNSGDIPKDMWTTLGL